MLMNTGHVPVQSRNQLLTTVAWQGPQALSKAWHSTAYALEGSVFMAGATVQWLRDGLQIIQKASDVEALAASVPNTDDVYLIPAFKSAHCACRLRGHRLASGRCVFGHVQRQWLGIDRTARRWGCQPKQFADANAGRCIGRTGSSRQRHRDHCIAQPTWRDWPLGFGRAPMKSQPNGRSIESLCRIQVIAPLKPGKPDMHVGEKLSTVHELGRKIRNTE